jgi:hypothetical protein
MVEQQVEIKILVPDFQMVFAAGECETDPGFNEEIPEPFQE